jgi:hypothetical protein
MNSRALVKPIIVALVLATLILILAPFVTGYCARAQQSSGEPSPGQLSIARQMEAGGIMSEKDFLRIDEIDIRAFNGRSVSSSDISWAVHLLAARPTVDNAFNRHSRITELTGRVLYLPVKRFTYSERSIILDVFIPRLSDPIDEYRLGAVISLQHLNDKRAIPYVRPLLKDRSADVRAAAARAIQALVGNRPPRPNN